MKKNEYYWTENSLAFITTMSAVHSTCQVDNAAYIPMLFMWVTPLRATAAGIDINVIMWN